MVNLKTGKHFTDAPTMTRGGFLKGILASGIAPSITLGTIANARSANASVGGMMRNVGARNATSGKTGLVFLDYIELDGSQTFLTDELAVIKRIFEFDVYHDYDGLNVIHYLVHGIVIPNTNYKYIVSVKDFYNVSFYEASVLATNANVHVNTSRNLVIANDDCLISVNGSSAGAFVRETRNTTDKFKLFNSNSGFNGFVGRVYNAKMKNTDGELMHDWKPCEMNGRQGLYDVVTEKIIWPS